MPVDRGKLVPRNISWTLVKAILGAPLAIAGIVMMIMYINDYENNMTAGAVGIFCIAGGGILLYWYFTTKDSQTDFVYKSTNKKRRKGPIPNALIICARRDPETKLDVPVALKMVHLKNIPATARPHYFRNYKRHFYEIIVSTNGEKGLSRLQPAKMPDRKSFPPGLFNIPNAMQAVKEAIEYLPPNTLQKIAPGVLILAIIIVGVLMTMTMPQGV